MVSRPADYCPHCGESLETITFDGRERSRCPTCDDVVWHNPVPCASVAVVDRSRAEPAVLCVERAVPPGIGEWTLPGGHMEAGEEPAVAAVRELEEETGVAVDPDTLEILDATSMPPRNGKHVTTIHYVADWADAAGELLAGSDASAARFWSPATFDASGETFRPIHERRFRAAAAYFE
ncbi:NUDIX domain-containing protein [Natronorubrum thiooxidans]|uniref:ADP-ribose pyrophosphatase YjhB, NUDIX family n=1 Tax=Natronorubrum thiooxidans TaxID=308853 RepID=A0A1N7GH79_9EURY|nr:NUDIX domain-containing protein [Natronorubrum thiooxidans]SIS11947.1 ADP-ribose pyrophosphatase YjhB, NUDIX family [Natronorubrum thiooxidans]